MSHRITALLVTLAVGGGIPAALPAVSSAAHHRHCVKYKTYHKHGKKYKRCVKYR